MSLNTLIKCGCGRDCFVSQPATSQSLLQPDREMTEEQDEQD